MRKDVLIQELLLEGYTITPPKTQVNNQYQVHKVLAKYGKKTQEHFVLLSLDNQNNILKEDVIFKGTVNSINISPREVFIKALQRGATKVIISHNHPSGLLEASASDIEATKKIIKAGDILEVNVLDHIIVTKHGFISMRETYYYLWNNI